MLHILTIAVRQIMHAFALAIKNSQKYWRLAVLSKKEEIWSSCIILFSSRKAFGLHLCFIIKNVKKIFLFW